eukprot:10704473-Alexandrium_andersonii.AAC.1
MRSLRSMQFQCGWVSRPARSSHDMPSGLRPALAGYKSAASLRTSACCVRGCGGPWSSPGLTR